MNGDSEAAAPAVVRVVSVVSGDTYRVGLSGEDDVEGFRREARALLAAGVDPPRVSWYVAGAAEGELFDASGTPGGPAASAPAAGAPARITVPAFFVPLCERALLHTDPNRFGLLYRLLWRLVHEPALRHDALDVDRLHVEAMARAVRRDMHKMTAFVRFRPIGGAAAGAADLADLADVTDASSTSVAADTSAAGASRLQHIAWFEPEHHTLAATAPFFARRFANLRWAILTPERCVRWDGRALAFGPGARKADAPAADAAEALWLTYYQSIFNPARLKLKMMQKEMPKRYWKNLPEAVLIAPLTAASAVRTAAMIAAAGAPNRNLAANPEPARRRPMQSIALRLDQRPVVPAVPGSLAALHQATAACRDCPIGAHATQAVDGAGPVSARLMLVGEQPGDQEDLRGRPFVGPAGQLLVRALAQLGWPRETLFLTNAVRHFKFELRGKRRIHKTPAQQEQAACLHWLEREIALVAPEALVALGATAARALLGRPVAVMQERGRWHTRADGLRVLVTLHPSALLRLPPAEHDAAFAGWLADLGHAAAFGRVPDGSV